MPNPSSGMFFIENILEQNTMEVRNAIGQVILNARAQAGKTSIDLSNFSAGVYAVCVKQDSNTLTQIKIIKE